MAQALAGAEIRAVLLAGPSGSARHSLGRVRVSPMDPDRTGGMGGNQHPADASAIKAQPRLGRHLYGTPMNRLDIQQQMHSAITHLNTQF